MPRPLNPWLPWRESLVNCQPPDGELLSIWWSGLAGIQMDVDADTVHFDGANGWRAEITGPDVAPIGVAAVAECY